MTKFKKHAIVLVIITLLFSIVKSLVPIYEFPTSFQFGYANFAKTVTFLEAEGQLNLLRITFIVDILWAPILLSFLFRIIKEIYKRKPSILFVIFCCLSLFFDYWENAIYIIARGPELLVSLEYIEQLKLASYGLTFLLFLYFSVRFLIKHLFKRSGYVIYVLVKFLKYNFLSLFIIAIILMLLTLMNQGSTIIVDLFMRPLNLLGAFFALFFMAIVLSHYPSYIRAFLADQKRIEWRMSSGLGSRWTGFGLVYFEVVKNSILKSPKESELLKIMRHNIGLGVLCTFSYLLLFVGKEYNVLHSLFDPSLAILLFVFFVYLYYCFKDKTWDKNRRLFTITLAISLVLSIVSSVLSGIYGWSFYSLLSGLLTLLSFKLLYILFRIHRKDIIPSDLKFIRIVAIIGLISLFFLLFINFNKAFLVDHINPLLILILYLINIYGFVMLAIKHIFFYWETQSEDKIRDRFKQYGYLIPTLLISITIWLVISRRMPSDLHTLPLHNTERVIEEKTFLERLDSGLKETDSTYFQVSSYGGGLKADLWTMLVLNKIQKTDSSFLNKTLSMSGTSGGMIGIGNYAALCLFKEREKISYDSLYHYINAIGNFSHLSIDITHLLGRDFFRELLPIKKYYEGNDRSHQASLFYSKLTKFDHFDDKPFRSSFAELFDSLGYFPPLLINTFATSGTQGVGLSIKSNFEAPGAIDIIHDKWEMSFYGALSTSNRFPIFSPTANVKNKGHFLDGGYFDNSGLTSTLAFRNHILDTLNQYLQTEDSLKFENLKKLTDSNIYTVIINSSKNDYIKKIFDTLVEQYGIQEDQVGEISAIVTGIAGLDKVPSYFEGMVKNKIHFYLPQPFDYQDVVDAYDGKPNIHPDTIHRIIKCELEKIEYALAAYGPYKSAWGTVSPPLARLNSEPAVRYQEAMIHHHKDVKSAINTIRKALYFKKNHPKINMICNPQINYFIFVAYKKP